MYIPNLSSTDLFGNDTIGVNTTFADSGIFGSQSNTTLLIVAGAGIAGLIILLTMRRK